MAIYPKEYLDSTSGDTARSNCFVLMPFARQFDEVYFAIRTACEVPDLLLSCSRADDFYGAGHIMEDILEGIVHSEYIVADVTGKNPNVFYELGLAHAARKPVVFVAGDIEDVPFDVRHLRVVVFDVREPGWSDKLRRDITTYLKNTRSEPEKSIPQPYREFPLDDQEGQPTEQTGPTKKARK